MTSTKRRRLRKQKRMSELFPLSDLNTTNVEGNWDASMRMTDEEVKNDPLYKNYVKPLVDSWLGVKPESEDTQRSINPESSDL